MGNQKIKVTNRHTNIVGYNVPDNVSGLERDFAPGETKEIEYDELKKLSWTKGGKRLLKEYLVIEDEEVVKDILGNDIEPEYYYTLEDVKNLLLNGTLDQLLDCLEFGTNGVIELIKEYAVECEIPDIRKRNAITKVTGFDINGAIEIKNAEKDPGEEYKPVEKVRRSAPIEKKEESKRRAAAPVSNKYKVIE